MCVYIVAVLHVPLANKPIITDTIISHSTTVDTRAAPIPTRDRGKLTRLQGL